MNLNPKLFECLPNELLLEIFTYLDIRYVYQSFDGLNLRLNNLIRSIDQSFLILSSNDNGHDFDREIYSSSIDNLIVQRNAEVSLTYFPNLRRLILHWLPRNVLDKLELDALPYLEYLFIRFRRNTDEDSIFDFPEKIFTNGFSRLQICILPDVWIESNSHRWIDTPLITILKIGEIDLEIYRDILSSCSNLRIFECVINRWSIIPEDIPLHLNVRTLVLKQLTLDHRIFKRCLSCLPNIQRLDIETIDFSTSPGILYSKIDAFKMIVHSDLTKLRRMNFQLTLVLDFENVLMNNEVFHRLERDFSSEENNNCRMRLSIERKTSID